MDQIKDNIARWVTNGIKECSKHLNVEPADVSWNEFYSFITNEAKKTGKDITPRTLSLIRNAGGYANIKKANFPSSPTKEFFEIKKAIKENKFLSTNDLTENLFLNKFAELTTKLYQKPIVVPAKPMKTNKALDRHLHLVLSDVHFGARFKKDFGTHTYGALESSRRLAQVMNQVVEFKAQYRDHTKLYMNIVGDIIQGKLHDPLDGEELADQINEAIFLLIQAVSYAANHFPEVEVNCATGNHDRNNSRHKERATLGKNDSYGTIIYFAVKKALELSKYKNVKINIPKTPWITYNSFGANYFGTHGDTVLTLPNPGSSINVKSIENQINKLNASLKDSEEYKVVFAGHVHAGMVLKLSNGVTFVTNPALVPPDHYANSIGVFESQTGQFLWESVKGYPFGDSRFLLVDSNTDSNKELDKIIKPYNGY